MKVTEEILVRYGEIFLKSEFVRKRYEKKLIENIKQAMKRYGLAVKVRRERGRVFIEADKIEEACKVLGKVFGIVSVSPCYHLHTAKLEEIMEFCKQSYEKWIRPTQSFAVDARRTGKHSFTSKEIENAVGSVINRRVDLEDPDVTIGIEVRSNDTYVYTKSISCLGGMPVSTGGKVMVLLSGGIDSPVAAFFAMKRGCKVSFVHFHSFPLVSRASIDKVKELVKVLNNYQHSSVLYLVPFQDIQMKIKSSVEPKYRIILYRRMMLRIAEVLAKKEDAKALVTGESLAQVSSQTLENMATIGNAIDMLVLRPLVGMDKDEIVRMAKSIGTYEISIKPQEDCCTLFVPKHPATKSPLALIEKLERRLKVKQMVAKAVKNAERTVIQD